MWTLAQWGVSRSDDDFAWWMSNTLPKKPATTRFDSFRSNSRFGKFAFMTSFADTPKESPGQANNTWCDNKKAITQIFSPLFSSFGRRLLPRWHRKAPRMFSEDASIITTQRLFLTTQVEGRATKTKGNRFCEFFAKSQENNNRSSIFCLRAAHQMFVW